MPIASSSRRQSVFHEFCIAIAAAPVFFGSIPVLSYGLDPALRFYLRAAAHCHFLARLGIVSSAFLRSKRKILIVVSFIFAAIVSPTTDIFTQTMIAVPLIVLYEMSLFIVRVVMRK